MRELLPCPFCGGEAKIVHSENGWQLKQTHDDSCWLSDATTVKAVIGEWDETKAIAAWNSRAERTCRNKAIDVNRVTPAEFRTDNLICSACGETVFADSEGINYPIDWQYCPNCGARVVGE